MVTSIHCKTMSKPTANTSANPDWAAILRQHTAWLRTIVGARTQDPHVVDDVMQDVAIRVLGQQKPLNDMSRVAPWLYRVAMHQLLQHRRSNGRRKKRQERFAAGRTECSPDPDPLRSVIAVETQQQIHNSLDALPEQDRALLLLRHVEGWTHRQIADHLGISIDRVIYRIGRARRRMRVEWVHASKVNDNESHTD